MSKKLSIIRFKPKPEHYDDFLQDVVENGKERDPGTHFVMRKDDEVIAIVIRDSEGFEQNAQDGVVNWLDERRPMLQEFDPVNRHTIPMTGDLIEQYLKDLNCFRIFDLWKVSVAVIFLIF